MRACAWAAALVWLGAGCAVPNPKLIRGELTAEFPQSFDRGLAGEQVVDPRVAAAEQRERTLRVARESAQRQRQTAEQRKRLEAAGRADADPGVRRSPRGGRVPTCW